MVAAGLLSGGPSTVITLARGQNLLDSTRAAGILLGKRSLIRGGMAHVIITLFWTAVLAALLPRRRPVVEGLVAGAAIAALDLGVVGRRFPEIGALDAGPQVLDHLAFGVVASVALTSA
ncbi:MAG: hypothetical protein QOG87_2555 [Actinomycetota bacterium]